MLVGWFAGLLVGWLVPLCVWAVVAEQLQRKVFGAWALVTGESRWELAAERKTAAYKSLVLTRKVFRGWRDLVWWGINLKIETILPGFVKFWHGVSGISPMIDAMI